MPQAMKSQLRNLKWMSLIYIAMEKIYNTNNRDLLSEMAKVHTSFTQVEVQILMFENTLVKVEVWDLRFTQVKSIHYYCLSSVTLGLGLTSFWHINRK